MHCANNTWSGVWKIGSGGRVLTVSVSVPVSFEDEGVYHDVGFELYVTQDQDVFEASALYDSIDCKL
jgi:hypothetical protein